jgi:hypothetical protein
MNLHLSIAPHRATRVAPCAGFPARVDDIDPLTSRHNLIPPYGHQFTGKSQNTSFGIATYVEKGNVADYCYQAYTTIPVRAPCVHALKVDLHALSLAHANAHT